HLRLVWIAAASNSGNASAWQSKLGSDPPAEAGLEVGFDIGGALAPGGGERSADVVFAATRDQIANRVGGDSAVELAKLAGHGIGERQIGSGREPLDPF